MFVLLTILYIVAIGKILCQVQVSQEVKYLPSPFLPGRTTLPVNYHWPSASPQTFRITEKSVFFLNKNNISATTQQPASNKNQQKRRLFISWLESRNMDNRPFVNPAITNNRSSTSAQNNTRNSTRDENKTNNASKVDDIYDKVMFEDDPPMEINVVNSGGPTTRNGSSNTTGAVASVTQAPSPAKMTQPPPPVNVTQAPSPVNVTVEDRSSFDGDACPKGYIRVNGMCVMPD